MGDPGWLNHLRGDCERSDAGALPIPHPGSLGVFGRAPRSSASLP